MLFIEENLKKLKTTMLKNCVKFNVLIEFIYLYFETKKSKNQN